jgi:uncharacterized membrane protein YbhN (UPF0104 family)
MTGARMRLAVAVAVLAVVVWRVGTGPFLEGLRLVDGWSVAWVCAITAVTTVCCAWRWHLVSAGLGIAVPMRDAVAAYYRSQLLNLTLPGGVVGDVHRAVRHGRDVGDVGRGARAVVWERTAGQVVQLVLTVVLLLVLPSPVRRVVPVVVLGLVLVAVVVALVGRALPRSGASRLARGVRVAIDDVRDGLLAPRRWLGIALTSALVVAGHTTTFLVAARTAGVTTSMTALLPLALLVLAAMAVPLSLGGWGPREGVAAWAFAVAGLGASLGVTTAVVYGVLVLIASLPGVVVLLADARRRPATIGVVRDVELAVGGGARA